MNNMEVQLFDSTFDQIAERFVRCTTEQRQEMLIQLDAIAKKLDPVQTHRTQEQVLADLKKAVDSGGDRASDFFAHSFVDWYRSNKKVKSQLSHWSQLDMNNRRLFIEMLALRDLGRWDDETLYQFEQYCLTVIGGKK